MADPDGPLSPAQYEILDVIWEAAEIGSTVSEIWSVIGERRGITRTTVLNQVDRLEKRDWLRRKKHEDGFRYIATRSREQASQGLVDQFVDSFFGGSASELAMSLLGSKKLNPTEISKLRKLLGEVSSTKKSKS